MTDDRGLVERLAAVPDRLAASAATAPPPAPGEWSATEVVRHLIAVEQEVWLPRLAKLEAEEHPRWEWAEPGPWPGEPGATLDELLDRYRGLRAATLARLTALGEAGWARTGTHQTFGELDVAGLMAKAIDHDEEHLAGLATT